jgi:hypothetical protein
MPDRTHPSSKPFARWLQEAFTRSALVQRLALDVTPVSSLASVTPSAHDRVEIPAAPRSGGDELL